MLSFGLSLTAQQVGATLAFARPTITGTPEVGQTLTANGTGGTFQWTRDGSPIGGATSSTYTLVGADDGAAIRVEETQGGDTVASNPVTVYYAAPTAASGLADQSFSNNSGDQTYDVSGDFTFGKAGTYSIQTGPAGVTVNSSGVVTFDTDALLEQAGTSIVVRLSDPLDASRFADSAFSLDITAEVATPALSAFSITDDGGGSGTLNLTTDVDCTVEVWVGPTGTTPGDANVWAGTGANATITQAITTAGGPYSLTVPSGLGGNYRVSVVGRVLPSGPFSNVVTQSPVAFDTTVPGVTSFTPADDATDQAIDVNLVIVFNESMDTTPPNPAVVTLYDASDDSVVQAFDIDAGDGTWSTTTNANDTLTLNPVSDLSNSANYYVQYSGLTDANGNEITALADKTTWNFGTVASGPTYIFETDFGSDFPTNYPLTDAAIASTRATATHQPTQTFTVATADGSLEGDKTANFPSVDIYLEDTPLVAGNSYRVHYEVVTGIGTWNAGGGFRVFNKDTGGTGPYDLEDTFSNPGSTQTLESGSIDITVDPSATGDELIMRIRGSWSNSTGGTSGGDYHFSRIAVEQL